MLPWHQIALITTDCVPVGKLCFVDVHADGLKIQARPPPLPLLRLSLLRLSLLLQLRLCCGCAALPHPTRNCCSNLGTVGYCCSNLGTDGAVVGPGAHQAMAQANVLTGGPLPFDTMVSIAVSETVILLHPPLPLVGVSIAMERERQQNDSLADGQVSTIRRGDIIGFQGECGGSGRGEGGNEQAAGAGTGGRDDGGLRSLLLLLRHRCPLTSAPRGALALPYGRVHSCALATARRAGPDKAWRALRPPDPRRVSPIPLFIPIETPTTFTGGCYQMTSSQPHPPQEPRATKEMACCESVVNLFGSVLREEVLLGSPTPAARSPTHSPTHPPTHPTTQQPTHPPTHAHRKASKPAAEHSAARC